MGLATIDPHSQKEQEIPKIPKFGVYLQRNVWPSGRFVGQRPDGHTFLCKF